jgi:hypothetical protein
VKKVTYHIIASCLSIFQAWFRGENLIICTTATIIIAASVAIGRYAKKGVKYSRVNQTINQVITHVTPVVAHDFKFTAVLEKLQATQYQPNKLELKFASHCHINSLFGDSGFFVV